MNKELQSLYDLIETMNAYNEISNNAYIDIEKLDDKISLIEAALKRLEKLEGITCKEQKDADEILDFLLIRNKTLEIINAKEVDVFSIKYTASLEMYNYRMKTSGFAYAHRLLTQEEYDLLKEKLCAD